MFVTMNRIYIRPEYAAAFEERFRHRAREVDRVPGFVRNLVLRPAGPDQPYVVMTFWASEEAFNNWVNSEAFRQGHARSGTLPEDVFTRPSQLEKYEAFLDSAGQGEARG